MPTPAALVDRIRLVRGRVRFAVCLRGVAWLVAIVGGLLVLAGFGDRALHFDPPALRLSLLAGIVIVALAATWRLIAAPFFVPLSDLALALRVEERYGGLEERLASALEFQTAGRS